MSQTVLRQLDEVKENQRLGLRVRGASTDEEAADVLHKFVINEDMWAGGMTASLAKNPFLASYVDFLRYARKIRRRVFCRENKF